MTHPDQLAYLKAFEELPAHIKADNIAAARRIAEILALVGLFIVPEEEAPASDPTEIRRVVEAHVELLAEAEHDGWMATKQQEGWVLGERDDKNRIHPLLRPFSKLDEKEKDKDREAVRLWPTIVEIAGFQIVSRLGHVSVKQG